MSNQQPDAAWWAQARLSRDRLAAAILGHPAVALVDLGLDPQGQVRLPVLRVHLRPDQTPPNLPAQLDGIIVRAMAGDYGLEGGPTPDA